MAGVRDLMAAIAPKWRQRSVSTGSIAAKIDQVVGLQIDKLIEKAEEGSKAHMPGIGDPSALPLIGADRNIVQGPNESNASYAARLQAAFDVLRRAGNAWSVLEEIYGYFSPLLPRLDDWSDTGARDEFPAGSDPTKPPVHYPPGSWDWDGFTRWWREWTIIFAPSTSPAICIGEGTWGDGDLWGDATKSWGLSLPATTWESVRSIISAFKGAHTFHVWTIVSLDNSLFNPAAPSTMPDGTWGPWSKTVSGIRVPSRAATARYTDGVL